MLSDWWTQWPDANVGIATGQDSGLVVLDVDPRNGGDESLRDLQRLHGSLPPTVEAITGGGGRHIYFRHPGPCTIPNRTGILPGLDVKADGGFVVAPPSRHISGGQYAWELSSHLDDVPLAPLPPWLMKLIRGSTEKPKAPSPEARIPEGKRNDTLFRDGCSMRARGFDFEAIRAALLARNQKCDPPLDDEEVLEIAENVVGRYTPEQAVIAVASARENVADQLVRLAEEEKIDLFHDERLDPFGAVEVAGRQRILSLRSQDFHRWLSRIYYTATTKAAKREQRDTAAAVLAAKGMFEGPRRTLAVRVASHEDAIWIDLDGSRAVRVTRHGWDIIGRPPVLFRSFPTQAPLPDPLGGGKLTELFDFVHLLDDTNDANDSILQIGGARLLVLVYLVVGFVPDIPVCAVIIHGIQGAGKSTLLKLFKRILDPGVVELRGSVRNLDDYALAGFQNRVLYFDNLSHVPDWLSDALCRTVTGEGWSKRTNYTDEDSTVYRMRSLVGLSSINPVSDRPDLLDRSLILPLEPISADERRPEREFWREFEAARPRIFGAILDTLVTAMNLEASTILPRLPRMADFARWGAAVTRALGLEAEDFLSAYDTNIGRQNELAVDASPVAQAVLGLMVSRSSWRGSPADLLEELGRVAENLRIDTNTRRWPKTSSWVTRRLREVQPNLLALGIEFQEDRSASERTLLLSRTGENAVTSVTAVTDNAANDLEMTAFWRDDSK